MITSDRKNKKAVASISKNNYQAEDINSGLNSDFQKSVIRS